ncbi:hypothetical protein [Paraburkholderia sp. J7]|uniref:hypothetical protein n=1 Tax=Paraburkholderia sp. J7 TaxID=2805438 RepID=UPI002AB65AA6|nr:hypothetical protein [Paraburkholderia sp. J7]
MQIATAAACRVLRQSMHAQRVQLTEPDARAPGENSPKTRSSNGKARIHDNPAIAPMWRDHDQAIAAAPGLIEASDQQGRDTVALARERKLPAGIIERMESLQRKLHKRRP